jgi:hypothetical protein
MKNKIPLLLAHILKYNPTILRMDNAMVARWLKIAYGSILNIRASKTHAYITEDYKPSPSEVAQFGKFVASRLEPHHPMALLLNQEIKSYALRPESEIIKPKQTRRRVKK